MHLAREKLTTNEEDIRQAPSLMDVAKYLPYFHWSLVTFNMYKLPIHQIESNDGHCLLDTLLVVFLLLKVRTGR